MEIRVPEDTWPVHVDPAGLEIALINILTNAREAMTAGGKVTISARNVLDAATEDSGLEGPFVALTISDTGTGVAPENLARVFEPFFSTKKNGGSGLGLTQVHSFATGSGGAVKVASLAGHGSAFTLLLPRSNEPRAVRADTAPSANLPRTIMIVDDTPASLESVRLALDGIVPTIFVAAGGPEAIEILNRHPEIEAIVSDIMMPGMSGIELAEEIRRRNASLPVVLMTGYSDEAGGRYGSRTSGRPETLQGRGSGRLPGEGENLGGPIGKRRTSGNSDKGLISLDTCVRLIFSRDCGKPTPVPMLLSIGGHADITGPFERNPGQSLPFALCGDATLEQAPSEAVTGQVASSDNSVGACGVMITSEQLRAARALLRWKQKDLAEAARVSLP